MSTQFVKMPTEVLYSNDLNSDEKLVYAMMIDRRELSKKSKSFYSNKSKDWFIMYTQESMAQVLNKTRRTVGKIYAHLEQLNLITRVSRRNASDLIFLPRCEKNSQPDAKKVPNNQTESKQTNKSKIYTVNTEKDELDKSRKIDLWKQAVIEKIGFTEQTANLILKQANNDLNMAYKLVRIITNARNNVVEEASLKRSKETDFKTNYNLSNGLTVKLSYLFRYLPNTLDEQVRYMTTTLKNYFKDILGIKEDNYVSNSSRYRTNIEIPDWMNEKYDPEKDKISKTKKADIERKMLLLKNSY